MNTPKDKLERPANPVVPEGLGGEVYFTHEVKPELIDKDVPHPNANDGRPDVKSP
jgi:hypothetical protein